MRPSDHVFASALNSGVDIWIETHGPLPGLNSLARRDALIHQLVDSDRRRRFIEHYRGSARLTPRQAQPGTGVFDPYAAAVLAHRAGDLDDALWLVFLATHFGRHPVSRWRYTEHVYGRLGQGRWDWSTTSSDVPAFSAWLASNADAVKGARPNGFGNHRKRESIGVTGAVVDSYVKWIVPHGGHGDAVEFITASAGGDPADEFELLYESMAAVFRFGRLARLDYLTTAHRLGLISAVAGRPYLPDATRPLDGARLLFGVTQPTVVEEVAIDFGRVVGVGFAVLEDAICNWQKTPDTFTRFRG